jgi:hypothetical protein
LGIKTAPSRWQYNIIALNHLHYQTNFPQHPHYPPQSTKMVAFGKLITSAVALAIPALAAVTPAQIVSNIEMITQKSAALQAPAKTITLVNAPLLVIGQGPLPTIITGFTDIVTTATNAISQMQGSSPVPAGADSDAIADAFRSVSLKCCSNFQIALTNLL